MGEGRGVDGENWHKKIRTIIARDVVVERLLRPEMRGSYYRIYKPRKRGVRP